MPRHRRAPGSLEPGQLYHVTNRGVDRCDIFHSDLDRIVFLSLLAEACLLTGAICHAWSLMTTHFHVVIEDQRGVLSQMMHHLEFCYARYFNDTRRRRRRGPLFESRFCAELIDSAAYFHDAVAYVLLNPVRTQVPLAPSPEGYRWSSAALVCSEVTPAAFCAGLLTPMGGLDGVLAALPPSRFKTSRERRRARLDALVSGAWLDRDRVLSGRLPELYRLMLSARAAHSLPIDDPSIRHAIPLGAALSADHARLVARRPAFAGLDLDEALFQIECTCRRFLPTSLLVAPQRLADVVAYTLWRFTSAGADRIAGATGIARDRVDDLLRQIRGTRILDLAWQRLLWTLEWALRWQLRAAPHRP